MYQIHSNVDREVSQTLEGFYWAWGERTDILTFYESLQYFERDWKKVVGFQKFGSYSKQILMESFRTNSRSLQWSQQNFSFLIPGSGITKAAMKDKSALTAELSACLIFSLDRFMFHASQSSSTVQHSHITFIT